MTYVVQRNWIQAKWLVNEWTMGIYGTFRLHGQTDQHLGGWVRRINGWMGRTNGWMGEGPEKRTQYWPDSYSSSLASSPEVGGEGHRRVLPINAENIFSNKPSYTGGGCKEQLSSILSALVTTCVCTHKSACQWEEFQIHSQERWARNVIMHPNSPPAKFIVECTLQASMAEQLSGVCRYPTGALTTVRSGAEISLLRLWLSVSQEASLVNFSIHWWNMLEWMEAYRLYFSIDLCPEAKPDW